MQGCAGNHHPPRSQRPRPTSRCAMRPFAPPLHDHRRRGTLVSALSSLIQRRRRFPMQGCAGNHLPPRSQRPRPTSRCAMRPFADLLFTTTDGGAPSSARSLFPHSTSPSLSEITFPRATDMLRIAFQWCILVMACKIRRQRIAGGVRWPRKQYISVRDSLSICCCCCVRM